MHDLMHEKWKLMQKEGYKSLTCLGREKTCKKNGGKRQKIGLEPWLSHIEREKVEKLLKKWVWTCENQFLKNSLHDFQSIEKQIQSVENASIDPTTIEHQSRQTKTHNHL